MARQAYPSPFHGIQTNSGARHTKCRADGHTRQGLRLYCRETWSRKTSAIVPAHPCELIAPYAFRWLLCGGARDEQLNAAVHKAIVHRPKRHDFRELPKAIVSYMNHTVG